MSPLQARWQNPCHLAWSGDIIYWPRKDERLSWPGWLTCSGWFTHISGHPSAAGRVQDGENTLAKDRRYTTEPRNQPEGNLLTQVYLEKRLLNGSSQPYICPTRWTHFCMFVRPCLCCSRWVSGCVSISIWRAHDTGAEVIQPGSAAASYPWWRRVVGRRDV